MTRERRYLVITVCLALLASLPPSVAWSFGEIIFFGDSLSDGGNHFIETGQSSHQPFQPIPDNSYAIGGHHFSNGKTWAEQLATLLKTPTSGKPALRNPGHFTNYAFGRARARADAPQFSDFDLATQVENFLSDFGGEAPGDALYVIWIGPNDLGDALLALPGDPTFATSFDIINQAVTAVAAGILALSDAGAQEFLILNAPDPGNTPFARALGPEAVAAAHFLTAVYNSSLALAMPPLPGLTMFDVDAFIQELIDNHVAFGLENVEDPCLRLIGFDANKLICSRPNRRLFWDGIHPTTAAHRLLAERVAEFLAP